LTPPLARSGTGTNEIFDNFSEYNIMN